MMADDPNTPQPDPAIKTPDLIDQDFQDAGILIGNSLEAENHIAGKLVAIHDETKTKPFDVVAQNFEDPTIRDDLLSSRTDTPRAFARPPKPEPESVIETRVEGGTAFSVEVRPDGSEWLLGRAGEEGGASVMIKGPTAPDDAPPGIPNPVVPPPQPEVTLTGVIADIGRGTIQGAGKMVQEVTIATGLDGLANYLEEKFPLGEIPLPETKTGAGEAASGMAQAVTAMIPAVRGLRALGVSSAFLQWTIGGAVADFAAFSPDDPALGDMAKAIGKLNNKQLEAVRSVFADALAKEESDSDLVKRVKAAAGGVIAGATIDAMIKMFRGSKSLLRSIMDKRLSRPMAGMPALAGITSGKEDATDEDAQFQVAGLLDKLIRPIIRGAREAGPRTAREEVLARISRSLVRPHKNRWRDLYRDAVDDLHPLDRAVKEAIGRGKALAVSDDPYKLARLNRGVNGKAEHFLEYGTFKFGTFKNVGPSLKAILEPVKDNLDDFRAYAVAKRSLELEARGIETGVSLDAAKATVAEMQDMMEPVFRRVVEYQDQVLDYLADSGVLKPEAVAAMREANRDYVPFFRVMDREGETGAGALGRGLGVRQPVRRIKGSERQIVDPLESIVKNTYLFLNLADRNAVGDALLRLGERFPDSGIAKVIPAPRVPTRVTGEEAIRANPEIRQVLEQYQADTGKAVNVEDFSVFRPNSFNVGPDQIAVYRDGKRLLVEVDPDIAATFKALDGESAGMLTRILGAPARLLRAGAVLSPEFIGRNPFRDQLSAFIFSDSGFKPFMDLGRGVFHMVKKDGIYQDWLKSGGPMASLVSLDRRYLQQNIRQIMGETSLGEKVVNVVTSPIEALRILSDLAERGTRVGEFGRAVGKAGMDKNTIMEAGLRSREVTLDFQRIGAKTRAVNSVIAFWNAWVQGHDKVIRAFREHPARTTARIGASITMPSVALQVVNRKYHDDPNDPNRYSNIPQWQRDLFWLVRAGDTWYRIPKPFELGIVFGSGAERITDYILSKDPKAFDNMLETLGRGGAPGFMPTALTPFIETWANKSLFTNRPIIPASREDLLPEYQYSGFTTETAKAVGKLIAQIPTIGQTQAASPAVIENWVRSWTGGLGMHIVAAADFALRKTGALPDPVYPANTLADIPFVKGFVVRHPTAGAEPIQKFFDAYDEQQAFQKTIKALIDEGNPDEAIKVMERAVDEGQMNELKGIKEALTNALKTVRMIYRNPAMTRDEKRQLIDATYGQMVMMAQTGNQMVELGVKLAKETSKVLQSVPSSEQRPIEDILKPR